MAILLVPWAEAKAQGLRWYFTGVSCKRGHITRRRFSNRRCETCEKDVVEAWRVANPDKVKAIVAGYRERHRETLLERGRIGSAKRRLEHPEKVRSEVRAAWDKNRTTYNKTTALYRRNNPDIVRAANEQYRARKRAAPGKITTAEFATILTRQKFRCHWCGASIRSGSQMDHVIPLKRGGEHSAANVVGSCGSCNRRKRSKDPIAWANELGRLF